MKRILVSIIGTLFISFSLVSARADDSANLIVIQPEFGYHAPRIFAESQSAGYTGMSYGGSLYYKIGLGEGDFSLAPFAAYTIGSFNSGANSASRTETLKERTLGLGLKFYFGNAFVKANYAWTNAKDETTGSLNQTISDSSTGIGGGLGIAFSLSTYLKVEFSFDVQNVTFKPNPQGFSSSSQYLRFGGTVGLGIILPSTPARKSYMLKTSAPKID